jgi:hypothetical protein
MAYLVDRERDTEAAEKVRAWIADQTVGGVKPRAVEAVRGEDAAADPAWWFVVRLPDPAPDVGTWPVEVLNQFDRSVRDKAIEEHLSYPWYVAYLPENEEEQEDEDQLQLPEG